MDDRINLAEERRIRRQVEDYLVKDTCRRYFIDWHRPLTYQELQDVADARGFSVGTVNKAVQRLRERWVARGCK